MTHESSSENVRTATMQMKVSAWPRVSSPFNFLQLLYCIGANLTCHSRYGR